MCGEMFMGEIEGYVIDIYFVYEIFNNLAVRFLGVKKREDLKKLNSNMLVFFVVVST